MRPPGMTDEVFVDLQANRHLQHPKYIHQCDQLYKTCQVILTMGGVKIAEAPPFLRPLLPHRQVECI